MRKILKKNRQLITSFQEREFYELKLEGIDNTQSEPIITIEEGDLVNRNHFKYLGVCINYNKFGKDERGVNVE